MTARCQQLILQAVANMAWADGRLDPREIELLQSLAQELGIPRLWEGWLNAPPCPVNLDQLLHDLSEVSDQNDFLTILLATCLADQEVDPRELELLLQVSEHFGLDRSIFEELEAA